MNFTSLDRRRVRGRVGTMLARFLTPARGLSTDKNMCAFDFHRSQEGLSSEANLGNYQSPISEAELSASPQSTIDGHPQGYLLKA